ncbi:hypothetical protein SUZIE_193505 [Sciurus carolinensis]|uniref:Uncharacterized protein n=1 Tax=Sciurus carolinensis TaxID=30640 RepID=A0AA41NCA6_SCICA|nr:hypothetical protein [Sciurus carolinensis]
MPHYVRPGRGHSLRGHHQGLMKGEIVEEAENGRGVPASGNANEKNGEQEAEEEVDEEEEEGDGEEEAGEEEAAEDEEADAGTKQQKPNEEA